LKKILQIFLWSTLMLFPALPYGAEIPQELAIGTVTEFPTEDLPKFQALADYLEEKLKPSGVKWVKVVLPGSLRAMGYLVKEGKVDLIFDSPLAALAVGQIGKIHYLLRQWREGVPEYHSIVFSRSDGPVQKTSDLPGYAMAMESPYSTSGYLLPQYYLRHEGFAFVRIHRAKEKPPPDKIGYAFTYWEPLALEWVKRGLIKAGVVNNLVFEKNEKQNSELKKIYATPPIYRQVVAYPEGMSPELLQKIKEILLNMAQDPEGRKILSRFYQTERFDEIPEGPEAYEKSLQVFAPFLKQDLQL
jgi:phosphonate transport system substrate-binding protein